MYLLSVAPGKTFVLIFKLLLKEMENLKKFVNITVLEFLQFINSTFECNPEWVRCIDSSDWCSIVLNNVPQFNATSSFLAPLVNLFYQIESKSSKFCLLLLTIFSKSSKLTSFAIRISIVARNSGGMTFAV